MQSVPEDSSQDAVRREWPSPFSRTATPDWILWVAPFGRVGTEYPVDARSPRSGRLPLVASALERAGKRPPAVLRLWARAKAIPGEARLALNRFPTRCIRNYYLDRVLELSRMVSDCGEIITRSGQGARREIGLLACATRTLFEEDARLGPIHRTYRPGSKQRCGCG